MSSRVRWVDPHSGQTSWAGASSESLAFGAFETGFGGLAVDEDRPEEEL
jgi:hypothetical protein